jgi:FkbM family methyltransferase
MLWKRLVRQAAVAVGKRYGYSVVRTAQLRMVPQAIYLERLFRDFGVTGVLDVGANEGQYYRFLRDDVGFRGPVVSVEPIPSLVAHLRSMQARDPQWTVEELALGPKRGTADFTVTANSQFSSFRSVLPSTLERFRSATAVERIVQVTVETLDVLIQRHRATLGDRIYLKLDTQGYDLDALRGLDSERDSVVALQSESSVRAIYDGAPNYHDTIQFVEGMGYLMSDIFPNNEGHYPLMIEFDCHFVRVPASK